MIERNCQACNKIFLTWPCVVKKGFGKFCSHKCSIPNKGGTFAKGNKAWNKGKKTGIVPPNKKEPIIKFCKICILKFEVQPYRAKTALFCSRFCKSKSIIPWNKDKKGVQVAWNKGKPNLRIRGENNPNWRGGKTSERVTAMGRIEYILWRTSVFMRDDYTCQKCDVRGGELQADHIKPWALYPELRYAIDNGQTLCINCHKQTDTWGWRGHNFLRRDLP